MVRTILFHSINAGSILAECKPISIASTLKRFGKEKLAKMWKKSFSFFSLVGCPQFFFGKKATLRKQKFPRGRGGLRRKNFERILFTYFSFDSFLNHVKNINVKSLEAIAFWSCTQHIKPPRISSLTICLRKRSFRRQSFLTFLF